MSHSATSRRDFLLRSTAALAAAGAVTPYWFSGENARADQTKSKHDRPRIGAIGVGGQGSYVASWAARFGDVVAVCDADLSHAERAKNDPHIGKGKARVYQDYRKLLERKRRGRDHQRHARPLAHGHQPRRLPLRPGYLYRKAADAHHRRRQTTVQSGRGDRPDRPGRHHAAER